MNNKLVGLIVAGIGLGLMFLMGDEKKEEKPAIEKTEPKPEKDEDDEAEPDPIIEPQPVNFFSARSKMILLSCHEQLQILMNEVLKEIDITIIEGYRNEINQNRLVDEGYSQLNYPDSKHNSDPSLAVDIAPYNKKLKRIVWNDTNAFKNLAVIVKQKAKELNIPIKWGGDWLSFIDMPHWELEG